MVVESIAHLLLIALGQQLGHKEAAEIAAPVDAKQSQLKHVMLQTLTQA